MVRESSTRERVGEFELRTRKILITTSLLDGGGLLPFLPQAMERLGFGQHFGDVELGELAEAHAGAIEGFADAAMQLEVTLLSPWAAVGFFAALQEWLSRGNARLILDDISNDTSRTLLAPLSDDDRSWLRARASLARGTSAGA